MQNDSVSDSLLLSSAQAISDNVENELDDLEDDVYIMQAKADAHPYLDYNNTDTNFHVSLGEFEEKRQQIAMQRTRLRKQLRKAKEYVMAHGYFGQSSDTKLQVRENRNNIDEYLEELEVVMEEITGETKIHQLMTEEHSPPL